MGLSWLSHHRANNAKAAPCLGFATGNRSLTDRAHLKSIINESYRFIRLMSALFPKDPTLISVMTTVPTPTRIFIFGIFLPFSVPFCHVCVILGIQII